MGNSRIIVVTGPESTGKTALCQELSAHYQCTWVPEIARTYLQENGPDYQRNDLLLIAEQQMKSIFQAVQEEVSWMICDTDWLTIAIWSAFKYGQVDDKILQWSRAFQPDLYLLCAPDIPWEQDPLREHPNEREQIYSLYINWLTKYHLPYSIVNGLHSNRLQSALDTLDAWNIVKAP